MKKLAYIVIGVIEVLIGVTTAIGCTVVQTVGFNGFHAKPLNVYIFVVATAMASLFLGINLLRHKEWASRLLVFFSGYIVLTKIMIFLGLLSFNGEMLVVIPVWSKNIISLSYHIAVILILSFVAGQKKGTNSFY